MEPIVKTMLPLQPWMLQKCAGPVFPSSGWRTVALSFVPPSKSLVSSIMREYVHWDSPALLSPSYRRRVRNRYKHYIKRLLHNNPYMVPIWKWLLSQRQKLEAQGGTADPSRIRKLREIESETNNYFQQLIQTEQLPEELTGIVRENPDALNLLWEFAVYGEGGNKPKLRPNSGVWTAFGLDPGQLDSMSPVDGLILCLDRFMGLMGLAGQPAEESNLLRLTKWIVRTHLPSEEELATTPGARSKAMEAGLTHRGIVTRDKETGQVAEIDVEGLNAADFIREVEEGGNQTSEAEGAQADSQVFQADAMECLTNFAELAGIDLNDFTPGEQARLLSLLDAHKKDYDKASKKGMSYKDAYGQRADSEKTQRARLFKKIREKARHRFTE